MNPAQAPSLAHAFAPADLIIDSFEADLFETFADELTKELNPSTRYELALVDRIIDCYWRLRRAGRLESDKLRSYLTTPGKSLGESLFEDDQRRCLFALSAHETRIERSMYRAMKELQELKRGQKDEASAVAKGNSGTSSASPEVGWLQPDHPEPAENLLFLKTKREAVAAAQKQIEDLGDLEEHLQDLVWQHEELREEFAAQQGQPEGQRRRAKHDLLQIEAKLAAYVEAIERFREGKFEETNPIEAIHVWVKRKMEVTRSELKRLTTTFTTAEACDADVGCGSDATARVSDTSQQTKSGQEDSGSATPEDRDAPQIPPVGEQWSFPCIGEGNVADSALGEQPEAEVGEPGESGGTVPASATPSEAANEVHNGDPEQPPKPARSDREVVSVVGEPNSDRQKAPTPPKQKEEKHSPPPARSARRLNSQTREALEKLRHCQRKLLEARQNSGFIERDNQVFLWQKEVDRQIYLTQHLLPPELVPFDPNEPQLDTT